jgi:hypothetical protein
MNKSKVCEISNKIIKVLGPCHQEYIYHNAFLVELRHLRVNYASEVPIPILYSGEVVGHKRADIVIYSDAQESSKRGKEKPINCILELKAIRKTTNSDLHQLTKYINSVECDLGFLINFSPSGTVYVEEVNRDGVVTQDEAEQEHPGVLSIY